MDARSTLQDPAEVEFFARYMLGQKGDLDARLRAAADGFRIIFPNDRKVPVYACDKCVKLSHLSPDNWVYSKTGFLRND